MAQHACPFLAIDPSGQDLYGEIARIRAQGPAVEVELPGGVRAWWINGLELNKRLLAGPETSKDAFQHWPAWINGDISRTWPLAIWVSVRNMVTAYGTDHSRLRRPMAAAFTKRRVDALLPRVQEIVDRALDDLERIPEGEVVDLRAGFAAPIPHEVVCELFGVPPGEDGPRSALYRIINRFFDTAITLEDAQANGVELYGTLTAFLQYKREHPADDLTTALMAAHDEGSLSEQELMDNLILLLTAGFETTVNLIDNTVHSLLAHPDQLELVRTGQVTWEDAIEESLRFEAPGAMSGLRYAVEDIEIEPGLTIPKGDPVVVSFAGAGRDPERHGPDAERFDVTRSTSRDHVSFGHGVHHCLGRPLAMAEATVALTSLFDRFPRLALADPSRPPQRLRSIISTGHQELPVLLHGRGAGSQPGPRPEEAEAIRKLSGLGGTSGTRVPRV
ncbi:MULTISPECIES: cytochrome P450 family protein [Streptomyces]|uniref:Cytochrome P450 107B1 n=1 Tax=Streptomyces chartreusis NRRL 3882 TaxID=1079985 RepID=A0A2N9BB00_STRCX|nr:MULTISPECIES: cytochrome P450 [Streptomyces]MYS91423.1 cytochrome P450 [Streptomyces sp. SID5464]SOR80529.1 Cytochrome P450 107B1 [Streptomyces chartreusis NRRL 3882]